MGLDYERRPLMPPQESLRELARLARTAGATVVGQTLQRRRHPSPATYVGSGKLQDIQKARQTTGYTLVIFDEQLSPAQQLRLETALEVKVLDRSALILDIFASRARTREASLQVELAQHEYLLPRLRGQWQHLERTEGAIGARGPGETQLETDRRLIGTRISRLKRSIESVRTQRAVHRRRRERDGIPVVALVGYTNAGKSSLLQALAGVEALTADAPFATLDPLTRRVGAPDGHAFLITDTVGFIQKLSPKVVAAFRATLEELEQSDILLHVIDVTHPKAPEQTEVVEHTLKDLGLEKRPRLLVMNKMDLLSSNTNGAAGQRFSLRESTPGVLVSAAKRWNLDDLLREIENSLLAIDGPLTVASTGGGRLR